MNVGPMLKQKGFDDNKPEKKLVAETWSKMPAQAEELENAA